MFTLQSSPGNDVPGNEWGLRELMPTAVGPSHRVDVCVAKTRSSERRGVGGAPAGILPGSSEEGETGEETCAHTSTDLFFSQVTATSGQLCMNCREK